MEPIRMMNATKIETPTRIDIMSEEAYMIFKGAIPMLKEKHAVVIEKPSPNAKNRGVYMVAFLDKHLLEQHTVQWLTM